MHYCDREVFGMRQGDRSADDSTEDNLDEEPVVIPVDGVLDLHTFSPRELPQLLDDYFDACLEAGIIDLRIIHGKGTGTLRERVRSILARHPLVEGFGEAPLDAGGWGATLVQLKPCGGVRS
jgi:DNA-nicking Smr family endonuclease